MLMQLSAMGHSGIEGCDPSLELTKRMFLVAIRVVKRNDCGFYPISHI